MVASDGVFISFLHMMVQASEHLHRETGESPQEISIKLSSYLFDYCYIAFLERHMVQPWTILPLKEFRVHGPCVDVRFWRD